MKKYILTMAAILVMGSMNAQEIMNIKMADGRIMGVPTANISKVYFDTTQVKADTEFSELQMFKQHIKDCNDKLGEYFNSANFTNLNSSLTRLLNLSLFNDSTVKKLNQRIQDRIQANMVKLDTIKIPNDFEKILIKNGYVYETSYNFPNVHFIYNATTKDWDVSELTKDIVISYPETDGALTTVTITPKSDAYSEIASMAVIQGATLSKSNIFYRVKLCNDYTINVTCGNETLASGEVTHGDINIIGMSRSTNISLNIANYSLTCNRTAEEGTGMNKCSASISKNGTNLISLNFETQYTTNQFNLTNLALDCFGKIQLKGKVSKYPRTVRYFNAAILAEDSATVTQYCDSINQNVKFALYYDNVDNKIGDFSMNAGSMGTYWTPFPCITFETVGRPSSFFKELTLKEIGGVYELARSFSNDVIFGLINVFRQFQSEVVSNQE